MCSLYSVATSSCAPPESRSSGPPCLPWSQGNWCAPSGSTTGCCLPPYTRSTSARMLAGSETSPPHRWSGGGGLPWLPAQRSPSARSRLPCTAPSCGALYGGSTLASAASYTSYLSPGECAPSGSSSIWAGPSPP
eukprot:1176090-Prorocentrum_minimum.AAC.3